jgi:transposase
MTHQIHRELGRLELLLEQIKKVENGTGRYARARTRVVARSGDVVQHCRSGSRVRGVLWGEGLFRHFGNRRQIAAYAGLAPTPWQSGSIDQEQGIGKSGNPRLQSTLLEMAWLWLRHQPGSDLSRWFNERILSGSGSQYYVGWPAAKDACGPTRSRVDI